MSAPGFPRSRPWGPPVLAGVGSGALFASSVWFPPLGLVLCLLSPLPVALAACRQGVGGGLAAALGGALACLAATGPMGVAVYLPQFAAAGLVLGTLTRAGRSPEAVVGGYVLVATVAFWGWLAALALQSGTGVLEFLGETVGQSVEAASRLLLPEEPDAQAALAVQNWAEQTSRILSLTFPGFFVVLATLTGWANALLLRRLVRETSPAPWSAWRAPEAWIWGLIGSGLLGLLVRGPLGVAAVNLFIAALAVYFLQGLAVVQHLFEARRFPRVFRVLAYVLLFAQLPVMLLVAILGAFDLWFDFRARWSPSPPAHGGRA